MLLSERKRRFRDGKESRLGRHQEQLNERLVFDENALVLSEVAHEMTAPLLKQLRRGFSNEPAASVSDTLPNFHARGGQRQAFARAAMPGASSRARAAHDLLERNHMQRPSLLIRQHSKD